jgi:hypothetical protein
MAEEFVAGTFNLGHDAYTGTTTKMHMEHDGTMRIVDEFNLDAVAEMNKAQRNDVSKTTKSGDMVHVARLPMQVYLDLQQRGIIRDKSAMKRWLASDEALPYRTHWMAS